MAYLDTNCDITIIAGDVNAKSPLWGEKRNDKPGVIMAEWIAQNDLTILNDEISPTFCVENYTSIIDLTLSTELYGSNSTCYDLEDEKLSDHRYIFFEVKWVRNATDKETEQLG